MSNSKIKSTIGKRIRKARKEVGLSQKQLAARLKLSDKAVSAYEVGRVMPSFAKIRQISKVVHKPIAYFDEEVDPKELNIGIKIKIVEKELAEIKRLLRKGNKV